jgi:hypothetical protein
MLEAAFLGDCPNQKKMDDTMQASPYFMDIHEWGCGPYPPGSTASSFPKVNSYSCMLNMNRPGSVAPSSAHKPIWTNDRGTHPPVGKAQMLYDLCMAAYELSTEPLGSGGDPNVLMYPLDHLGGVTWAVRYARLYTEFYLYENCGDGRIGPPPNEMDPDFSKTRNFGCGPYN